MTPYASQLRFTTFLARTTRLLLVMMLAFCASFSGLAVTYASECESTPSEAESMEFEVEIVLTEKKCRRKVRQQTDRLSSGCLLARLLSHSSEHSHCLSMPALTEHELRNGGIGTSLRC